MSHTSY